MSLEDLNPATEEGNLFSYENLDGDIVKIKIVLDNGDIWEKEYPKSTPVQQILKDYKQEYEQDLPDKYFKAMSSINPVYRLNQSLELLLNPKQNTNEIQPLKDSLHCDKEEIKPEVIGKPFHNPFEVYIFKRSDKILEIQNYDNNEVTKTELDKYNPSSAYCNGQDMLFISGGETKYHEFLNKFWVIDLKSENNQIMSYEIPPKANHSMIFIPPCYVFIVGGNDKKTYIYEIDNQTFFQCNDLNEQRNEPSLIKMGESLYCFDNINKGDNKLTFEKADLSSSDFKWEILYPKFNSNKIEFFPQKFFGVAKEGKNEVLFLGGNMDLNDSDNDECKNYKYNIKTDQIEESEIPYQEFNFKEKTFSIYNDNVSYLLPDFNRHSPEVVFLVRKKKKLEKINYKPKSINISKEKPDQVESIIDLNMPEIKINSKNNVQIGLNFNNIIDNDNIDKQNNIEVEDNGDNERNIKLKSEENMPPPYKELNISANKGDNDINIDIPSNEHFNNDKEDDINLNLGIDTNIINDDKVIEVNQDDINLNNEQKELNLKLNVRPTILTNENKDNLDQNVNVTADINNIIPDVDIKTDKQKEIKPVVELKATTGIDEIKEYTINGNIYKILPGEIFINEKENFKYSGVIKGKNPKKIEITPTQGKLDVDINGKKSGKIEGEIHGKSIKPPEINTKIDTNVDLGLDSKKIDIDQKDINIKGPEIKNPKGEVNINKDIKIDAKLPKIETNINVENKNEFPLTGIIHGKLKKKVNITGNIPNVKKDIDIDLNKKVDLDMKNKVDIDLNKKVDIDLNKKVDIDLNKNVDLDLKKKVDIDLNKKVDLDLNKKIDVDVNGLETNNLNVEFNNNINTDLDKNIFKNKVNLDGPNIDQKIEGNIDYPRISDNKLNLNLNTNIIEGNANIPGLDINNNFGLNKPKIDSNFEVKGNMPEFGINKDININKPKIDANFEGSGKLPGLGFNNNINIDKPKIDTNFEGSGKLPGFGLNSDFKVDKPKINGDFDGQINTPEIGLSNNLNFEKPNINSNLGGKINVPKIDISNNIKSDLPNINNNIGGDIKLPEVGLNNKLGISKQELNANLGENVGKLEIKNKFDGPKLDGKLNIPDYGINNDNIKVNANLPEFDLNNNINIDKPNINPPKIEGNAVVPTVNLDKKIDISGPKLNDSGIGLRLNTPAFNNQNDIKIEGPNVGSGIKISTDNKGKLDPNLNAGIDIDKKIELDQNLPKVIVRNEPKVGFSLKGTIKGKKSKQVKVELKENIQGEVKVTNSVSPKKIQVDLTKSKNQLSASQRKNIHGTMDDPNFDQVQEIRGSRRILNSQYVEDDEIINEKVDKTKLNMHAFEENLNNEQINYELPFNVDTKREINIKSSKVGDNEKDKENINNNLKMGLSIKGSRILPVAGQKNDQFVSSKIEIGGNLNTDNIETNNMQSVHVGINRKDDKIIN